MKKIVKSKNDGKLQLYGETITIIIINMFKIQENGIIEK